MKTEPCELTNLCLLRDGTRILLQNRTARDWRGWALPGGHVEPGEAVVDSCVREMEEETGLRVLDPRLAGVKQFPGGDGSRYLVFLFVADRFEGTLRSSPEGEMRWIERKELSSLAAVKDLPELIEMMEDPGKSEFRYVVDACGKWQKEIL